MRKHRADGGVNEAEEDLKDKPEARTNAKKIDAEAEERKLGGRTKRKHGGEVHRSGCKCEKCRGGMREERKRGGGVKHHEKMEDLDHAKHVGKVHGEVKHHAGRSPRKSGGRAGSDSHPFSSARAGEAPRGHKVEKTPV